MRSGNSANRQENVSVAPKTRPTRATVLLHHVKQVVGAQKKSIPSNGVDILALVDIGMEIASRVGSCSKVAEPKSATDTNKTLICALVSQRKQRSDFLCAAKIVASARDGELSKPRKCMAEQAANLVACALLAFLASSLQSSNGRLASAPPIPLWAPVARKSVIGPMVTEES